MAEKTRLGNDRVRVPDPFAALSSPVPAAAPQAGSVRASAPVLGEDYRAVRLAAITEASPMQTRASFDPEKDEDDRALLESLRDEGQRVPILLVEIEGASQPQFRVLDGHRRVDALRRLGAETVKAVIRRAGSLECDLTALAANVRKNLTPLEQARAIERLHAQHGLSWSEIAQKAGLTRRYLLELHALLAADPAVQSAIERGAISARAGLALKRAPRDQQPALAAIAEANGLSGAQAGQLVERVRAQDEAAELKLGASGDVGVNVEDGSRGAGRKAYRHLQAWFPELDEAAIKGLVEAATGKGAPAKVLMLAGLLVLEGAMPETAVDEAQAVSKTQVGKKLAAVLEALVYLQANPRTLGHNRVAWLSGLDRKLKGLMADVPTDIGSDKAQPQISGSLGHAWR